MMKKLLMGVFLLCTIVVFTAPAYAGFANVVSFGDSLSDNGISNYPVVGADTEGFTRFSNGYVWVEYLAMNLGIPHDGRAYGGATTQTGFPDLLWQIDNYTPTLIVDPNNPVDISNTLFTVWAGGNDLLGLLTPSGGDPYTVITTAVANIEIAITDLHTAGARNILVPNLPDLGNIPLTNKDFATSLGATYLTTQFNFALDSMLGDLSLNALNLFDLDVFSILNNEIIGQGFFVNDQDAWMGSGENIADYLFYDDIHPTTDGHWLLAQYATSAVPVPAAVWMLGSGLLFIFGIRRKIK